MHLTKLSSGTWRVAVKYKGARSTGTARTKAGATVLGAQMLLELGAQQTKDSVAVGELIDGHLSRVEWSPTTLANALRVAEQLPDVFRCRTVAEVNGPVLAGLYRQLAADGWSPHGVRCAHFVISTAWAEAITWGWATSNPCRAVKLPKVKGRDIHPPDTAQVRAILERVDGTFAVFLRLAATTGARRGELVALQWADIDVDRSVVWIARSLVQVHGAPVQRDTKTGSKGHRSVPLDLPTVAALRRLRARQNELALAAGLANPRWVFSHDAGVNPWRPDHPSRLFAHARQAAGVTGVRLHDLRHYVATTMLQDGESPLDVAAQLGHASTRTTLEVYAHYMPGRGRESADRRAARLDG